MTMKVSVLGIGCFGYALLRHLDRNVSETVSLHAYDYKQDVVVALKANRYHPCFSAEYTVSHTVVVEETLGGLLEGCDVLILAIPSEATRDVMRDIRNHSASPLFIVNTAKALDHVSGARISDVVRQELGEQVTGYAALAGGTIAKDLFEHEPLGVTIASDNAAFLSMLTGLFRSDELFVSASDDVVGLEYASAFKNVVSIVAGIVHGLGCSFGSETCIISRTAQEVEDLVLTHLGGRRETFRMGSQCWGNDVWMSALGETRNREFGVLVGNGASFADALKMMEEHNKTVEGIKTLESLSTIDALRAHPEKYPILTALTQLHANNLSLAAFKQRIFAQ